MGNGRLRWGPRYSGSSVERVRGTGYIRLGITRRPKAETKTEQTQRMSLKARKKKGIEPGLPRFSWDEPLPEPPPPPSHEDVLHKLELQLDGCKSEEIEQETDTHLIVSMLNKDGRPFKACWCKASGAISWLEGKHKPSRRLRNGPPRRKDCQ